METMTIKILVKNGYGLERYYPNCIKSRMFASIAGTKTLSRDNLFKIKGLGFTVVMEREKINNI